MYMSYLNKDVYNVHDFLVTSQVAHRTVTFTSFRSPPWIGR